MQNIFQKAKYLFLFTILALTAILSNASWATNFTIENTQFIFPFDPTVADGSNLHGLKIHSFNLSRQGVLLSGWADDSHSLYVKINPEGKTEWLHSIDQKWPVYSATYAFDSSDGGYWGIGYAYSRDIREEKRTKNPKPYELENEVGYQYLLKMDDQGNPLKQIKISTINGHNIECGLDTKDGLVFTGWDLLQIGYPSSPQGIRNLHVPWIEKTDIEGNILWQQTMSKDSQEILSIEFDERNTQNCRNLKILPTGNLIWAKSVKPLLFTSSDGKDALTKELDYSNLGLETIIFEFDKDGKEIRSTRNKDTDKIFLFLSSEGFSIVEHFQPHISDSARKLPMMQAFPYIMQANATDGGIRISDYDLNFNKLKTAEYKIPSINRILGDVFMKNKDEYFVAGCDLDQTQTVAHIFSNNQQPDIAQLPPTNKIMRQCATFGWAENPATHDMFLYDGNEVDGQRLMTISYKQ